MNQIQIRYDKTFEGFLTAVFECYEYKLDPMVFLHECQAGRLFGEIHETQSDPIKADRVWKGLKKRLSNTTATTLHAVFLSEAPDVELMLYRFIQKVFASNTSIEGNFADPAVLELTELGRQVMREAQRAAMFIRFQKTSDGLYVALFDPKFNILPLSLTHFTNRFADQDWLIYDTRRQYGYHYTNKQVSEVRFDGQTTFNANGTLPNDVLDADERLYQAMWKAYYHNISIPERRNYKLHRQLLPKRFWKYLPEKMGVTR